MPPFVYDPNLNQDEKNQQQGVQISGAAPSADSGGTTGKQKGPESFNTGSGFQNLDKYLQTNQPQQFGQQVAGQVQNQINTARQNIDQASQGFSQKVQGANNLPSQNDLNSALANPGQADAKQFQTWMNQNYSGPKSLAEDQSDYGKYWSGTSQANTQAKELGSEAGRFNLLNNYFGRPTYNYGQQSLDNLLIQQGNVGKQTQGLQDQAAQLKTYGNQQQKQLQNQASQRAGEVEQSRNNVNQAFTGAQSDVQNQIASQLSQQQAARAAEQQQVQKDLAEGKFSADELNRLGLSSGQDYYNLNLGDYLTKGGDLTKENVASDDQRNRLNALASLAGISQDYLGAGSSAAPSYAFDSGRFQNALSAQKAAYDAANKGVFDEYNQAKTTALSHMPNVFSNLNEANMTDEEKMNYLKDAIPRWQRDSGNYEGNTYTDQQKADFARAAQLAQDSINRYNNMKTTYQPDKKIGVR